MGSMFDAAESHKFQGNIFFKRQQYEDAINEYTTAIIKYSKNIVYYTNRALCYIRIKKFENAIIDCEKAIELDKNSMKGHYLLGQAIVESSRSPARLNEAIQSLRIAYDQSIIEKKGDTNEIGRVLLKARKRKFDIEDNKQIIENKELMDYLIGLIEKDRIDKIARALSDPNINDPNSEVEIINYEQSNRVKELKKVFVKADPLQKQREVPDYLFGKIHFNIMLDPVITPSGITYDRTEILEHLEKIGNFDPISRKEITEKDLIPNRSLREAIEDFLDYNGWASEE